MDVAAVRAAELEPPTRRSPGRLLVVAPIVALVALLALDAVLFALPRGKSTHDRVASAVLTAARQEAVNLTTISYVTAARDLNRIIDGATGGLRTQFMSQRAQFPSVLARDKSVSQGQVLSAGLISLTGNRQAQVDVATDATVTTTGGGSKAQSVVKHYRMVMKLSLEHGRWLVSDVAFAGAPQ